MIGQAQPRELPGSLRLNSTNPFPAYHWLRRNAPIWWNEAVKAWVITRYRDAVRVTRDSRTYCVIPYYAGAGRHRFAYEIDGPAHKDVRRVLTHGGIWSQRDILVRIGESIDRIAAEGVAQLPSCGTFNAVSQLAVPLVSQMFTVFFGLKPSEAQRIDWRELLTSDYADPGDSRTPGQRELVRDIIADRLRSPGSDPISRFLAGNAKVRARSLDELSWDVWSMLMTGPRTISDQVVLCVQALATAPRFHNSRYFRDRLTLRQSVNELVRYAPVVHLVAREARTDATLGGARIGAGDRMYVLHASANRDEAVWDDPEQLDLTRESTVPNLTFGVSPYRTPAASLVKIIVGAILKTFIARFGKFTQVEEMDTQLIIAGRGAYDDADNKSRSAADAQYCLVSMMLPKRLTLSA